MRTPDVLDELLGKFLGIVATLGGNEGNHLGETVADDEDIVESLRTREIDDMIHRERPMRSSRDRKGSEQSVGFVGVGLGSLTGFAGSDPVIHEAAHVRPVKIALDDLQGLGLSVVTGVARVVCLLENPDFESLEVGDVDTVARVEDIFAKFPAFVQVVTIGVRILESC